MTRPQDAPNDQTDDLEVLELVAEGIDQLEPIPVGAMEQAYGARFMGAMEAELAELVFDSLAIEQPAMRRGNENESRFLSFTNDNVTLDLSLLGDGRTIIGEIDPAIATEVVVEGDDGDSTTVAIDKFGRFKVAFDSQSFRLRVVNHLVTQWISR